MLNKPSIMCNGGGHFCVRASAIFKESTVNYMSYIIAPHIKKITLYLMTQKLCDDDSIYLGDLITSLDTSFANKSGILKQHSMIKSMKPVSIHNI